MAIAVKNDEGRLEDEGTLGGPKFDPPLYLQRYNAVIEVARRTQARKMWSKVSTAARILGAVEQVVDMGCAECKLLRRLKREKYIEELVGVDIDSVQLYVHQPIVYPLTTDFLNPRQMPLLVKLMQGSIAEPDMRLSNFDLIACVEVIEHLDPPVLEKVPASVFGVLQPRVVVVTTPNAEFNVLFPGFSGFRHHDHRFEWTREQFQTWCCSVCEKFPYSVEFGGVGCPPPDSKLQLKDVGYCSQMAIFTRLESGKPLTEADGIKTPYKIIAECAHPYEENPLSTEQKLCQEAEYYLFVLFQRKLQTVQESGYEDTELTSGAAKAVTKEHVVLEASSDTQQSSTLGTEEESSACTVQIGLKDLLCFPRIRNLCSSVDDIRSALQLSKLIQLDRTGKYALFDAQEEEMWSDTDSDNDDLQQVPPGSDVCDKDIRRGCSISVEQEECWD